jgi:hypothetical protein
MSGRVVTKTLPFIGVTEHTLDRQNRIIVLINYSPAIAY